MSEVFKHIVEHVSNSGSPGESLKVFVSAVKGVLDSALLDMTADKDGNIVVHRRSLTLLSDLSADLDTCQNDIMAAIMAKPDLNTVKTEETGKKKGIFG